MRPADNPFATQQIDRVVYRPQGWTWEELLERLRIFRYRASIVGARGSGKSRLLKELRAKLEERGFLVVDFRIGPDCSSFPKGLLRRLIFADGNREVILLDEADRLSTVRWLVLRVLSRRARGLIVTSHTPGLQPLLVECRTSVQLLDEILEELVGPEKPLIQELSGQLFREYRGNIREVLRALYDVHARLTP